MTTKKTKDARKHPRTRARLNVSVKYKDLDEFIKRNTNNISKGGIFIESDEVYPRRTRLNFEIRLTDGQSVLRGEGVVAWCCKPGDEGGGNPGMGIKFTVLDKSSKKLVDTIVDKKDGDFGGEIASLTLRPHKPASVRKPTKKTQPQLDDGRTASETESDKLLEEVQKKLLFEEKTNEGLTTELTKAKEELERAADERMQADAKSAKQLEKKTSELEIRKKQLIKTKAIAKKASAERNKLKARLEKSTSAHQALINEVDQTGENQAQANSKVAKQLDELKASSTENSGEIKKLKDALEKSQSAHSVSKNEIKKTKKDFEEQKKLLASSNEENETAITRIAALEDELEKSKTEYKNVMADFEKSKTDLENQKQSQSRSDTETLKTADEIDKLEETIDKLEQENEQAAAANRTIKDKVALLSQKTDSELMTLNNKVEEKKKELGQTNAHIEDLRQEIGRLETENATAIAKTEQLKQTLDSQEDTQSLKDDIEELRGEYKIALATCDELRQEMNRRSRPESTTAANQPGSTSTTTQEDAYIAYNFMGEVVDANDAACQLTDRDKTTLNLLLMSDLETSKYTSAIISKIIDRRTIKYETSIKRPGKTDIKVKASGELLSKENQGVIFITYKRT
jgi:uncharacterized protein (TIGR02266 family)